MAEKANDWFFMIYLDKALCHEFSHGLDKVMLKNKND